MNPMTLVLALCIPFSSFGSQILYEPFNYPVGGLGGHGGWSSVDDFSVASGSLTLPSPLSPSIGNSADIRSGGGAGRVLPSVISNGTVFVSYAFRINQPYGPGIIRYKQTVS